MLRWFRRGPAQRPCPLCSRPVALTAERCDACGRRFRPSRSVPLRPIVTPGLSISPTALDGLARRD